MTLPLPRGGSQGESSTLKALQGLVFFLIIFLFSAPGVPGINESHYLPKAKHLWDASFAPGDLFLDSHDAHFLTSALAGLASRWLSLDAVAWLGRIVSWGLLAISWMSLCRSLSLPALVRPLALATWLLGVRYGHWAGEWVVGGFEAKTLAYPLVIWGLSYVATGNWRWVWLCMGAAMAWHPVVGLWAGLSAGIAWLSYGALQRPWREQSPWREQWPWLAVGAALALLGVVPAAWGLGGPDVVDKVSAAQVHVYLRLPHHLSPQTFAPERHYAALVSLMLFLLANALWRRSLTSAKPASSLSLETVDGLGRLLRCAWIAIAAALIGLTLDVVLSHARPDIAAKLLRFYWFRWSDIMIPLVNALVFWSWLAIPFTTPVAATQLSSAGAVPQFSALRRSLLALAGVATVIAIAWQAPAFEARIVPAADQLVVDSVGRHSIQTDRYVDWLAVCDWIKHNTPGDSLWLTPKYQQSFKWHAQRAEVVCWKDVPQDNASVIEWYHRVEGTAPPRDSYGRIRDWTTQELLQLSARYGFRWILIDRSYQLQPPALEIKYPVVEDGEYPDNRSFAVLYIPDGLRGAAGPAAPAGSK